MEYVTGGELFDKIVEKGNYSEKDTIRLTRNVLDAIKHLHEKNIVHRYLKPENLLVKGNDDTHVMISDFGLSRVLGEESVAFTACGTPYYVAPEVVTSRGYGKEVDLWSVGVITYFLLAGFPPFMGETLPAIIEQIVSGEYDFPSPYWDQVSSKAKDFISKLLEVDPSKRLTADAALKHPWLAEKEVQSSQTRPLGNSSKMRESNKKWKDSQTNLL